MREFPCGKDYWNKHGSIWKSDPYTSTMYIPFTERTVEFGFLNGVSKTVTFDESDRFENPTKKKLGQINREQYYKFEDISLGYFRSRTFNNIADIMLSTTDDISPEIVITSANHLYTEPKESKEMVAVVKATIVDIYTGNLMKWKLKDIQSIERFPQEQIDENGCRYPTEGAIPEWIDES